MGRSLQQKLLKTGARLVKQARYPRPLAAESHLTRRYWKHGAAVNFFFSARCTACHPKSIMNSDVPHLYRKVRSFH